MDAEAFAWLSSGPQPAALSDPLMSTVQGRGLHKMQGHGAHLPSCLSHPLCIPGTESGTQGLRGGDCSRETKEIKEGRGRRRTEPSTFSTSMYSVLCLQTNSHFHPNKLPDGSISPSPWRCVVAAADTEWPLLPLHHGMPALLFP